MAACIYLLSQQRCCRLIFPVGASREKNVHWLQQGVICENLHLFNKPDSRRIFGYHLHDNGYCVKVTLSGDKASRWLISGPVPSFQYYSVHLSFSPLVCKRVAIFLTNGERGRKVKRAAGPGTSVYGRGLVESVSRSHWSHWNTGKTASHEP